MLSQIVASRAAKLIAACVCPVAGAGTLTVAVPEVRQAVHRATAPRAAARPARAPRQIARPQARPRIQPAVAAIECPPDAPIVLTGNSFAPEAVPVSYQPGALPPLAGGNQPSIPGTYVPVTPIGFVPIVPGPPTTGNPPPTENPGPVPVVPEPSTWVQMIIGFGIVGGALRNAWKRRDEDWVDDTQEA
ncbi:hypothetical protein GGR88_001826 [Sphingomonas jejuensis]|uniref:PEP-CTERM protein-sorting domain-containing protein n=1 Tax=Sphingomonas jejuensis TaxID=904715 RepID=A0ABX0XNN8_9SPHN|nr:hypothetical protein [Sphingomonas jejuensis]